MYDPPIILQFNYTGSVYFWTCIIATDHFFNTGGVREKYRFGFYLQIFKGLFFCLLTSYVNFHSLHGLFLQTMLVVMRKTKKISLHRQMNYVNFSVVSDGCAVKLFSSIQLFYMFLQHKIRILYYNDRPLKWAARRLRENSIPAWFDKIFLGTRYTDHALKLY